MHPEYRAILVATDFTPHSVLAFKHAAMLARKNDAQIHLMHVVPTIDSSMRGFLSTVLGDEKVDELTREN